MPPAIVFGSVAVPQRASSVPLRACATDHAA